MQGLFSKNDHKLQSLKKFSVLVDIQQLCAEIKFSQTWKNEKKSPIEASYQINLPRNIWLGGLTIKAKDKKIVGTIKEKEEAANDYDDAISSGHSSYLVEQTSANTYQLFVGNLAPNEIVEVELILLTLLKNEKGKLKFIIPAELFPQKADFDFTCSLNITQPVQSIHCNMTGAKVSEDFKKVTWQSSSEDASLPHPHPLIPYSGKTQEWACDAEGGCPHGINYFDIWPKVTRFNCSQGCNYDLCNKCMGPFTHPWHDHPLSPVKDNTHRWRCDGWKNTDGSLCRITAYGNHLHVPRYRCTTGCDYDLCQQCMDAKNTIAKDFLLIVDVVNMEPCALLETSPAGSSTNTSAVLVTHYPQWNNVNSDLLECKMELIFVVDRSGSMRPRWKNTVQAMNILIHALPNLSLFNIIGFGSSYQTLFQKSVPYNDQNLKIAERHCEGIQPDLGGTELLEPLRYIFQLPLNGSYPRVIIVLTDGEVENRDIVISTVKHHRGTAKLFCIGLGDQVDRALVEGIASAGDGDSTLVVAQENIQNAILTLFAKTFEPALKDVRVFWSEKENSPENKNSPENQISPENKNSLEITQTPHLLTVSNGQRVLVFGLVEKGNSDGIQSVTISGIDPEGNVLKWFVPITARREGMLVQRLAAASLIRDLEEKRSEYHFDNNGNDKIIPDTQLQEIKQKIKNRITSLSTTYQVASSHTSFQATVESDQPTETSLLKEPPTKLAVARAPDPVLVSRHRVFPPHKTNSIRLSFGSARSPHGYGGVGRGAIMSPHGFFGARGGRGGVKVSQSKRIPHRSRSRSPVPRSRSLKRGRSEELNDISDEFDIERNEREKERDRDRDRDVEIGECFNFKEEIELPEKKSKKLKQDILPEKKKSNKLKEDILPEEKKSKKRKMDTPTSSALLISKQAASGAWSLQDIAFFLEKSLENISQDNPGVNQEVWATALGIAILYVHYPVDAELWRMVVHKARLYLVQQITQGGVNDKKAAYTEAKVIEEKAIVTLKSLSPVK